MYKKLQFKIVLILVSFIVCVMTVVGAILIGNIFNYYENGFLTQQSEVFTDEFLSELEKTLVHEDYPERIKNTLWAYSARLGIDSYRNYYVLDADGNFLSGSVAQSDTRIKKTENLILSLADKL